MQVLPSLKWQAVYWGRLNADLGSVLHASAVRPHSQVFDPTREAERLVPKRKMKTGKGKDGEECILKTC